MSTAKKSGKMEDVQAALQALIAQGKKDGMIRDTDLNEVLSKMNLSPEKIEEVYDRFDAMNIQVTTSNLDALDDGLDVPGGDLGNGLDMLDDGIDLRGMDSMEAVAATERFLDNAVMAKLEKVTIIHGKGTGALRAAVQQSLRRNKAVKSFRLGRYGEGESGVTVVELK